ncbi:transposase [Phormidium tenue FACHB-886]|nr:transposase [Phormidium tenue FACHB-886]
MLLLPSYSPELNLDELLNHDVKVNAVGCKRAKTNREMMENVRQHLRRRQRRPDVIRCFFREKHVAYAAQ